jgi:hypothetical protein
LKHRFRVAIILASACGVVALAQAPDFSGTWRLDTSRSRVSEAAGLAGLIATGAPPTLHITQPSNGTMLIESQINEGHSRMYVPGGRTTTPAGQAGTISMASRWDGRTLVSEGRQESAAGTTTLVREVRETWSLGADGRSLLVEVTATTSGTKATSSLVYTKLADVGPCTSWPTPCKTPGL